MQAKVQQQSNKITKDEYEQNGWKFQAFKSGILPSYDLQEWANQLKLNHVPDIVFGQNKFQIINQKTGFIFEVNPKDSLKFVNYDIRKNRLFDQPYQKKTNQFNLINVIPSEVKVKFAAIWKQKKLAPEIQSEIKEVSQISDSFYSSPYKGSIKRLEVAEKDQEDAFNKEILTQIDQQSINIENIEKDQFFSEYTTDIIPVENLTEKNEIIWSSMISLWEDELGDNGLTQSDFRFRVMKDCFFGLIRHYLRVDDVIIRLYDTRIYHDFKWNYILREFTVKEDSYKNIQANGFKFTPQWMTDANQSFQIQNSIPKRLSYNDKIYFGLN